jgi:hypothetical protein
MIHSGNQRTPRPQYLCYAIVGLAELENQLDEKPSMEDFDNDEGRFLRYWKSWAKANVPVSQRAVSPLDQPKSQAIRKAMSKDGAC